MKQNILKRATTRNARLCSESENFGHYSSFDEVRNNKGWDFVENGTLLGVDGGFLFFSALTPNPSLSRSTKFASVDAGKYTEIVLRFKYKRNRSDSTATLGKVQFSTQQNSIFDNVKSVNFEVIPDNQWHTYFIDVSNLNSWVGFVTNLKISFSTNGQKDDEIFVDYIKIQQPEFLFCTDTCFEDLSSTSFASNFDLESLGTIAQNYSVANSSSTRVAEIILDPQNVVNKVFSLNNSVGGSLLGPTAIRQTPTGVNRGFFSFRFYVTELQGTFSLQANSITDVSILELSIGTNGKLRYREGLSVVDFEESHNITVNSWNSILISFDGDSLLYQVSLNGLVLQNDLPYLIQGQVNGSRFENPGVVSSNLLLDDIILIEFTSDSTSCPGIGKQGDLKGSAINFTFLTIEKNINDALIVNINNYGDVVVKLPAITSLDIFEIRNELEKAITSLDVGGYPYAEVVIKEGSLTIRSGTYGFDSSVVVKNYKTSTLAESLGFTLNGESVGVSSLGRPHSGSFSFSNNYRATTSSLNNLKETLKVDFGLYHNPKHQTAEIGSRLSGRVSRRNTLDGRGRTFIDFYHRATEEGNVKELFFHGVLPRSAGTKVSGGQGQIFSNIFVTNIVNLKDYNVVDGDILVIDEAGYTGNGSYKIELIDNTTVRLVDIQGLPNGTNIDFSINNIAKVKQFRPKKDGNLDLINESFIGLKDSQNFLYTRTADTHKISVNWNLHRGDLIGIYNATEVFVGSDIAGSPDALYVDILGDALGEGIVVEKVEGQGIRGLGLYAKSGVRQKRAVYEIELQETQSVEYIDIVGNQVSDIMEYNICTAVNNGFSVTATVTGTHSHAVEDTVGTIQIVTHQNVAYNTPALTDGQVFASNGFLGSFQSNVQGASYFYVSGDGEFAGYVFDESGVVDENSLEFPINSNGGPLFHLFVSEYEADAFDITYSWNVKKTIHKFVSYFKEYPNVDGFQLEYLRLDNLDSDGSRTGFELIGEGNPIEFDRVVFDNQIITPETTLQTDVYYRHFNKTFVGYVNTSNFQDGFAMQTFRRTPYTYLEKRFSPVDTKAFNWRILVHPSTKISETELYSFTESNINLSDVLELYFSLDGETFQRADPIQLNDTTVRYKIGVPTPHIRLVVEPTQPLYLDKLVAVTSDDLVRYNDPDTKKPVDIILTQAEPDQFTDPIKVEIKNGTCNSADLEISIDTEELVKDVLVKSSLNTLEEVIDPEIGPNGIILQDDNTTLRTTENVAINSTTFGLSNLAALATYYVTDQFIDENDYFKSGVDATKWDTSYVNFPQTPPQNSFFINLRSPPFDMASEVSSSAQVSGTSTAGLNSTWSISGSFSASIIAQYDARGSSADPMGSALGLVDSAGNELYIRKRRSLFGTGSIRNYSFYDVVAASGIISTKKTFDLFNPPTFGLVDDNVEYVLNMIRIKDTNTDILRFSYQDTVNGLGTLEWDGQEYFEINLNTLVTPLVEPIKLFIQNQWSDSPLPTVGTPAANGSHVRISRFNFGGITNFSSSYDWSAPPLLSGPGGQFNIDNKSDSLSGGKYVAVDLKRNYLLDILTNWTSNSNSLWNLNHAQFSNSNVDDVNLVEWGNSNKEDVRWVLFSTETIPTLAVSGVKYLENLRIYPDITRLPSNNIFNSKWEDLGNILTDGDLSTRITQLDYPLIAIRLADVFDMVDFQLLSDLGQEKQRSGQTSFLGWYKISDFSLSKNIAEDPRRVTDWSQWEFYEDVNKPVENIKWLSFRNKTFNTIGGGTNYYASEVLVRTRGSDDSSQGEFFDKIDFTEFAEWYTVDYTFFENIAIIDVSNSDFIDTLYGSSPLYSNIITTGNITFGEVYNMFEEDSDNTAHLHLLPANVWRVFGEVISYSGTTSETTISGNGIVIVVSGEQTFETDVIYSGTLVDGIELVVPDNTPGVPNTIQLQRFDGPNPTLDTSWTTIYTETDLATDVEINTGFGTTVTEIVFNGGEPYRLLFDDTITVSGLRLVVTNAVFLEEPDQTIEIDEFKILRKNSQANSNVVQLSNDYEVRSGGRRSLKITYLSGNSNSVKITTGSTFTSTIDPLWSIQDFLSLHMRIDRPDLLDFDNSYIKLGKNKDVTYIWPLSLIENSISTENLSQQLFRFLEASEKGEGFLDYNDPLRSDFESQVDFQKGPISFFEIELKPKNTTLDSINLWIDSPQIQRESFNLKGRFADTLYLNNSELIYYPMSNFDIRKGFFEVIITPDWDKGGRLTRKRDEVFTIFTIVNGIDESFSLFYDTRQGLVFVISTSEVKTSLLAGNFTFETQYRPIKLSVAWDSSGQYIDSRANSNIRLWVDDAFVGDFIQNWDIERTKDVYFFVGSRAYQSSVAINTLDNYPTTTARQVVPKTNSLTGGLENLIISREPSKVNFGELQFLRDKIYLSVDGITYYQGSDPVFPLVFENLPADGVVTVWVKTKLPKNKENISRDGFLRTRWRIRQ